MTDNQRSEISRFLSAALAIAVNGNAPVKFITDVLKLIADVNLRPEPAVMEITGE